MDIGLVWSYIRAYLPKFAPSSHPHSLDDGSSRQSIPWTRKTSVSFMILDTNGLDFESRVPWLEPAIQSRQDDKGQECRSQQSPHNNGGERSLDF